MAASRRLSLWPCASVPVKRFPNLPRSGAIKKVEAPSAPLLSDFTVQNPAQPTIAIVIEKLIAEAFGRAKKIGRFVEQASLKNSTLAIERKIAVNKVKKPHPQRAASVVPAGFRQLFGAIERRCDDRMAGSHL